MAADARGVLKNDKEFRLCLEEACVFAMPVVLRRLFVDIVLHGEPQNVLALWNEFASHFIEDYPRKYAAIPNVSRKDFMYLALQNIEEMMYAQKSSKFSLKDYTLPDYDRQRVQELKRLLNAPPEEVIDFVEESRKGKEMSALLNPKQKQVFDAVLHALNKPSDSNIMFVDGPGGSGKTFLYNCLIHHLTGQEQSVIAVAFTGIASQILVRGKTSHSQFGIPLDVHHESVSSVTLQSKAAKLIAKARLIIWDEASMIHVHHLSVVDRLLRDIHKKNQPFGGQVMLLGGDFRQILPIGNRFQTQHITASAIKQSSLWSKVKQFQLDTNMRAQDSKKFADWLLDLGDGKIPYTDDTNQEIVIPSEYRLPYDAQQPLRPLINFVYDNDSLHRPDMLHRRCILTPYNDDALEINDYVQQRLPGDGTVYRSVDSVTMESSDDSDYFPQEFLHALTPSGLPPHSLKLKKGAIVMLLRNMDLKKGHCNGTRLVITKLHRYSVECRHLDPNRSSEPFLIPRISLTANDVRMPFQLTRRQFPLRPAYAMTINKSQGQSFDKVGIWLSRPVFTHGQLYVAFSRSTCGKNVRVALPQGNIQTRNIVETTILSK